MALSETVNFWPFWKSSPKIETLSPADIQSIEGKIFQKDPTTVSIVYTPPTESSFKTSNSLDETKNNILKNKLLPKILKTSIIALAILGFTLLSSAFITFTAIKGISIIILPKFIICTIAAAAAVSAYLKAQKETAEDASNVQPQDSTAPISSSDQQQTSTDSAHLNAEPKTANEPFNPQPDLSTLISSSDQQQTSTNSAHLNAEPKTTNEPFNPQPLNSNTSSIVPRDLDLLRSAYIKTPKKLPNASQIFDSNLRPKDSLLLAREEILRQPTKQGINTNQAFDSSLRPRDSLLLAREKMLGQPTESSQSHIISEIDNNDLGCSLQPNDPLIAYFKDAHGI
jgi:hypothetical protein